MIKADAELLRKLYEAVGQIDASHNPPETLAAFRVAFDEVRDYLDGDAAELAFLRYFYKMAKHGMGPASGDVYRDIAREYKRIGKLPKQIEDDLFGT